MHSCKRLKHEKRCEKIFGPARFFPKSGRTGPEPDLRSGRIIRHFPDRTEGSAHYHHLAMYCSTFGLRAAFFSIFMSCCCDFVTCAMRYV